MSGIPQFGATEAGRVYGDRPAAFGIARKHDTIAVVRVTKPNAVWFDLPGGAIDHGEDAAAAVVREFGEETGLIVTAGPEITHADQRFINTDGESFNNRATFFEVDVVGSDSDLKCEDDHDLTWLPAFEAVRRLRHEAHAWAVTVWLRRNPE